MKRFHVYKHPDGRLEAVKVGFSIPGLLFGGLWLLWHKVWVFGSVAAIFGIAVYFVLPSSVGYVSGIPYGHRFGTPDLINIAIELVVGIFGNEWRMRTLLDRGFEEVSIVFARTGDGAKAEFLRNPMQTVVDTGASERIEPRFDKPDDSHLIS